MFLTRRKRLQLSRIIFLLSGVFLCSLYQLTIRARLPDPWPEPQRAGDPEDGSGLALDAGLLEMPEVMTNLTNVEPKNTNHTDVAQPSETATNRPIQTTSTTEKPTTTTNRTIVHCIYVDPNLPKPTPVPTPETDTTTLVPNTTASSPGEAPHIKGEYPVDIFSVEERRRGWVSLHIFGMIYMFVSLAIVCDEFFVPTLGVITDKLAISDDVAGATFMAAGGSAPELFTSLIGVFISHSNVGIGTIVGSAVFNILFVIGMCALFSREMLYLTWWPLFRDVSFYIIDLIMLIIFFLDNTIMWWESMMLVSGYALYVTFMKYNVQIERAFKYQLMKHKNIVKVIAVEEPEKDNGTSGEENRPPKPEDTDRLKLKPTLQRGGSSASLHNSTMRNTIFQLMIHTLDPLGEESVFNGDAKARSSLGCKVKFKDKAQILNDMARGKVENKKKEKSGEGEGQMEQPKEDAAPGAKEEDASQKPEAQKEGNAAAEGGSEKPGGSDDSEDDEEDDSDEESDEDSDDDDDENEDEAEEEGEEPLSLEWPDTRRKQATYLFLLPIVFPLWLTVPDVRNPASKRFFVITFLGSIVWIAIFSYLMVWWAHQVGETIGISEEIMGLTILAAGTSIPDLITSVIVARKGLGDMAVSSSVGSNIFDITMGLPVPWLMFSFYHSFAPVTVSSNGLFCAIVLLFLMLLFVIISIAACKWRMNKVLGFTMFILYFVFLVLSVMLEDRIIVCPVSI
ncbi:sodium/potassium/calcium exchanger 1 isoform X1 [Rhinichthys klamathensis goyatoka]|uniref:sodium/potassium/calcium exchanger 1 isoform X1 n=1 Tax=Rhinichthys klamathensis goyatoka TaxID=3034132 RepID=UPI0024B506F2|nr:sodium/potassium/calcium exchanger 1 isoform X1 [Rhinichthys klamathensis goyatoka]